MMGLPLLVFDWAPINDMGEYTFLVAALAHFGQPDLFPDSVYQLRLGGANQLIFAVTYVLGLAFDADLAVRILLAAIFGATPWALAHAARTFGRTPLVGVVLAPLALGFAFRWGLLAYSFSMVLLLFTLRPLEQFAASPTFRRAAVVTFAMIACTLAHSSAVVILGIVALPHVLRLWRKPVSALWIGTPVVASLALAMIQMARFNNNASASFREFANAEHPRLDRLAMLPAHLFGYFAGYESIALCILTAIALWWCSRGLPRTGDVLLRTLTAVAILAQYWIWPYGYNGAGLLYLRFLLPGVWLLVLALAPGPGTVTRKVAAAMLTVPIATTLALLPLYQSAQMNHRALLALEPQVARGSAIAWLDFAPSGLEGLGIPGHPSAELMARRGGRTWSISDVPQSPIQTRASTSWASGMRHHNPNNFVPEMDLARYRYVLVHVPGEKFLGPLAAAMAPCGQPRAYVHPFALIESNCLTVPIYASEPPLPANRPKTLGWRLRNSRGSIP